MNARPVTRPARTRLEPTVAGKILMPAGVSLATLAWAAGGAANLLAATVWAVLIADAIASLIVMRGLSVEPPEYDRAFAGSLARVPLSFHATPGPLAPRALTLHADHVRGDRPAGFRAALPRGRRTVVEFAQRWTDRGRVRRLVVTAASAHPLGLWRCRKRFELDVDVLVLPRPARIRDLREIDRAAGRRAAVTRAPSRGDEELHTLRPWRAGESMRGVHWKHSARRGALYAREFEATARPDVRLVLETRTRDASRRSFDRAVRIVAGLAARFLREGRRVRLVLGDRASAPTGDRARLWRMLAELAVVETEDGPSGASHVDPPRPGELLVLVLAGGGRSVPDAPRDWVVIDVDSDGPNSDLSWWRGVFDHDVGLERAPRPRGGAA